MTHQISWPSSITMSPPKGSISPNVAMGACARHLPRLSTIKDGSAWRPEIRSMLFRLRFNISNLALKIMAIQAPRRRERKKMMRPECRFINPSVPSSRGKWNQTHQRQPAKSTSPKALPCRLSFTRPSIAWRPSMLLMRLPSARSSRKWHRHSSSGTTRRMSTRRDLPNRRSYG